MPDLLSNAIRDDIAAMAEDVAAAIITNKTACDVMQVALDEVERSIFLELLQLTGENRCATARIMGWHRNTLNRELSRLNIALRRPKRKRKSSKSTL